MAEMVCEIVNAAIDAAENLMEDAIQACVEFAQVAHDTCVAIKEAWDNVDSGLKQWIITGVSIAVSFIPLVGPLISCVIDGTFVDILSVIKSGDWVVLGKCPLTFAPGGNVLKGWETVGGFSLGVNNVVAAGCT